MPALPPPAGKTPNFDHPEYKDTELIIMNSVFLALMRLPLPCVVLTVKIGQSAGTKVCCHFGVATYRADQISVEYRCSRGIHLPQRNYVIKSVLRTFLGSVSDRLGLSIGYGKHLWEIRAVTITRENLLITHAVQTSEQHELTPTAYEPTVNPLHHRGQLR